MRFAHILLVSTILTLSVHGEETPIAISWEKEFLTITHRELPDSPVSIHYLEAFCRPGSTDRNWHETVIPHTTTKLKSDQQGEIRLKNRLGDGVIVEHTIRAVPDGVSFNVRAHNPTPLVSEVHWAQPCMRVDKFVGLPMKHSGEHYLSKSFIYVDGTLTRMPTPQWATEARYVPGQVWCPKHVPRDDVNPRPLSDLVPSNGLIGCFSENEEWLLAMAWEPYQELFQGVITCLHSDFRVGGLEPGETKEIRGKIYFVKGNATTLLDAYKKDFPEHQED